MKSKNGIFVFAYKLSPRIEVFNIHDNTWITLVSPRDFKINYSATANEDGHKSFRHTKETLASYLDIVVTDKYIYTLFCEQKYIKKTMSNTNNIYVFDFDGNPVKKYVTDKPISFLEVKNDSIIYGLTYDIFPDIVKFEIN